MPAGLLAAVAVAAAAQALRGLARARALLPLVPLLLWVLLLRLPQLPVAPPLLLLLSWQAVACAHLPLQLYQKQLLWCQLTWQWHQLAVPPHLPPVPSSGRSPALVQLC